jgi:acyl dehydratase
VRLPSGLSQSTAGPLVHEIDARWLMAYAAALGETDAAYFDTCRPDGVIPHPLFPVCYEWPVAVEMRAALPEDIAIRSVHTTHDLTLHRPARAGDRLTTRAQVIRVEPRRSGSYVLTRFTTEDAAGAPVSTTDYGSIYLGVDSEPEGERLDGEDASAAGSAGTPAWSAPVTVAATLAHLYTECARIWNPVHTDRAVARRAGLPDIILHGTATLALAVSRVSAREGPGGAGRVTRVRGRFGAMVPMPSVLTVEGFTAGDGEAPRPFRVLDPEGQPAVRDGLIWMDDGGRAGRGGRT